MTVPSIQSAIPNSQFEIAPFPRLTLRAAFLIRYPSAFRTSQLSQVPPLARSPDPPSPRFLIFLSAPCPMLCALCPVPHACTSAATTPSYSLHSVSRLA